MEQTLIDLIERAESKDDLEALGKQHLSVDVDKRKGIETIRADLIERAESKDEPAEQSVPEEPAIEAQDSEASVSADSDEPEATNNPAADDEEPSAPSKPKGRLLKHQKTGRLFTWSAALANRRDMKEL